MTGEHAIAVNGSRLPGDGVMLAYREWNGAAAGLPVVLLHGITGSSADWRATASHLGGHRLLAPDARGHGESDWAADEAYGGDQHFADLSRMLDALEIERCVLAGFSMGGGVAIIAAACLPGRVPRAVVIDTYPGPSMTTGSRRIAQWIAGYAGGGAWFDPAIARHFGEQLAAGRDERLDLWPLWDAIECPVLVVRGEYSDVLPAATAREMLARQPRAELVEVAGVAHGIPYLRPRELAEAISGFVARAGDTILP